MTQSMTGKVALVVGGAGSIGAVAARQFAELGARIAISHRDSAEESASAASVMQSLPGEGHAAFIADVARTDTLVALRGEIERQFGRLDVLVNAAGFTKPVPHADLDALDDDLIDRMFAVNWRGQFAAIRTFAPMLKASGDGLIVSISSIAGSNGIGSSIAYCAAKAGIDVMTKSLARVLAPEVRVLAVAPGVVDTSFVPGRGADFNTKTANTTPLKRIATAEDIASAILACATQLGFATGTTFVVDGGRSL
ncbi:short-chain dehydrogenase [Bradyrhizobium sacchari]|uniref:3-oxoacyl-[acyl-carrier protein] reductase n=1 Tax=Bradyrhizobium sacchari TaxID=1399419 RepID=A0A560JNZ7_9BRAD|nr:SDR family oxidoreductase [Bradyrhizobium sacchari]OPY97027.1 short-chain dehydrogenase [Bradyrhizobium sacchari]TWB58772.1 3-oxoacyl-[acyl-carrier protein] reductase [Bradyrhizobium sacchari]TWB72868.1 3-oxoacyl-[acyl-carrier protein] reductase [Bradyrhizobium sacchari]